MGKIVVNWDESILDPETLIAEFERGRRNQEGRRASVMVTAGVKPADRDQVDRLIRTYGFSERVTSGFLVKLGLDALAEKAWTYVAAKEKIEERLEAAGYHDLVVADMIEKYPDLSELKKVVDTILVEE